MRFGRHTAPAEEPSWNDPWVVSPDQVTPGAPGMSEGVTPGAAGTPAGRELFVRHARKDGRMVAVLRAVDHGSSCVVEAEVLPNGTTQVVRPGPYTFADANQASAFVTEAVAALMYLGCDIQAQ
jgi:hypothetical protein